MRQPLNPETPLPAQPEGKDRATTAATRVLLVEDSPSDADLLQQSLQRASAGRFEFTCVERLDEALSRMGQAHFDVLLLDLWLPDSSGPETFRRALHAAPQLPIVVLTGANDEGLGLAAVQEGVQDYLVKGQTDGGQIARAMRYAIERKHAREQLSQQREWLRVTLVSIGDAVLAADTAGRITFLNPVAAGLTGWLEEQALGQPVQDVFQIINEQTRERSEDIVGRVLREGRVVTLANHTALITRDGREIPIEDSAAPIRDGAGNVAGAVLVFHDVTETRRAQEALASSENRLRALLESASQGVVAVDESGQFTLVNAQIEEMFRYTRDELLGQPMDILLPERYRQAHAQHVRDYFARPYTRVMCPALDLVGLTKDGHEFPLEISLSYVEQGGSRLALALITDITERKRAEARLQQAQKFESLGLLAGGVAHDFNNLLVGVIGNASLALEMLPPGNPTVELLKEVIKTGEQAAHLTRQMLAYSGKGKFLVEALDLSVLVPEMIGLVRPSISKKIALQLNLDAELPPIQADRGQVHQVFMNLALNAAEAIGSHDGLITVRTGVQELDDRLTRPHPAVPAPRPGKHVFLEVRDTGCGMDDATRAKIFDPFFSTKFTGRGLGLAAVSGILRGHKAAITVTSAPGKGSCFTVLFPAAEPAAKEQPLLAAPNAALRGAGVVLVVDDERVVREMAKRALERQGYTVLLADSGLAAIDTVRRHPGEIALVVLDLSMPHMSGEETLPELRKIRPEVKALVSSGYSEDETMTLFGGQRVTGFIQKPYTSMGIAEKVKACIG